MATRNPTLYDMFDADFANAKTLSSFAALFASEAQHRLAEIQLFIQWEHTVGGASDIDLTQRATIFDAARDHRMGDDS